MVLPYHQTRKPYIGNCGAKSGLKPDPAKTKASLSQSSQSQPSSFFACLSISNLLCCKTSAGSVELKQIAKAEAANGKSSCTATTTVSQAEEATANAAGDAITPSKVVVQAKTSQMQQIYHNKSEDDTSTVKQVRSWMFSKCSKSSKS